MKSKCKTHGFTPFAGSGANRLPLCAVPCCQKQLLHNTTYCDKLQAIQPAGVGIHFVQHCKRAMSCRQFFLAHRIKSALPKCQIMPDHESLVLFTGSCPVMLCGISPITLYPADGMPCKATGRLSERVLGSGNDITLLERCVCSRWIFALKN